MEPKEFIVHKPDNGKKNISKRIAQAKKSYAKKAERIDFQQLKENKLLIMLCSFVFLAVLTIILGMLVFHVPVVTVCIVILIEAGMAVCLHDLPIWVHGIVMIAEIILGIAVGKVVYMLLADLCYLAAIFLVKFAREKNAL